MLSQLTSILSKESSDLNNTQIAAKLTDAEKAYANKYIGIIRTVINDLRTAENNIVKKLPLNEIFAGTRYFVNANNLTSFRAVLAKLEITISNYNAYWK